MPLRSTIVGATSGVVLLAGLVGFAVGLPEVTGDEAHPEKESAEPGTPPADLIPETLLDGRLVRYSEIDPQLAQVFDEVEHYSTDNLTENFGTDVAVGIYSTQDESARVAVTIYAGESGLFLQTGPPVPPELSGNAQIVGEFARAGDSVCFAQWQPSAKAQGGPPVQAQCQRVVGGYTVNVYDAGGLTVEQTAEMVDDVVDQAGIE